MTTRNSFAAVSPNDRDIANPVCIASPASLSDLYTTRLLSCEPCRGI